MLYPTQGNVSSSEDRKTAIAKLLRELTGQARSKDSIDEDPNCQSSGSNSLKRDLTSPQEQPVDQSADREFQFGFVRKSLSGRSLHMLGINVGDVSER